jgi:hypothetical protein
MELPSIVFLGPRNSGKSSILRVVLAREPAYETIFIAPTKRNPRCYRVQTASLFPFSAWDFPGEYLWLQQKNKKTGNDLISLGGGIEALVFNDAVDDDTTRIAAPIQVPSTSSSSSSSSSLLMNRNNANNVAFAERTSVTRSPGSPSSRPASASSSSINLSSLGATEIASSSSQQQQQQQHSSLNQGELAAAFSQLEAANLLQRCYLTEEQSLVSCKAIVLVVDANEVLHSQEVMDHLRTTCALLQAIARSRSAQLGLRVSDVELPSLEVFVNKCDGDAFVRSEARAELLRATTILFSAEIADAGFTMKGGWSPQTQTSPNSSSTSSSSSSAAGAASTIASSSSPSSILPLSSTLVSSMGGTDTDNSTGGDRNSLKRGKNVLTSSSSSSSLIPLPPITVNFHLTSIYDKSILESFSRVAQKVSPGPVLLPHIESLCNALLASSGLEKVMLVDVHTKLFFSTDSNPLQGDLYSLCCDILDVATDVARVYDPVCGAYAAMAEVEASGSQPPPAKAVIEAAELARRFASDAGRCSSSFVRLSNRTAVYVKEVAPYLAALCIAVMPSEAGNDLTSSLNHTNTNNNNSNNNENSNQINVHRGNEPLPRSSLSLPFQALIDANIKTFGKALLELMSEVKQ